MKLIMNSKEDWLKFAIPLGILSGGLFIWFIIEKLLPALVEYYYAQP